LGERQIGALEMHCKKKRHVSLKIFENFGSAPGAEHARARQGTPDDARLLFRRAPDDARQAV
jgi:hypothetical protein